MKQLYHKHDVCTKNLLIKLATSVLPGISNGNNNYSSNDRIHAVGPNKLTNASPSYAESAITPFKPGLVTYSLQDSNNYVMNQSHERAPVTYPLNKTGFFPVLSQVYLNNLNSLKTKACNIDMNAKYDVYGPVFLGSKQNDCVPQQVYVLRNTAYSGSQTAEGNSLSDPSLFPGCFLDLPLGTAKHTCKAFTLNSHDSAKQALFELILQRQAYFIKGLPDAEGNLPTLVALTPEGLQTLLQINSNENIDDTNKLIDEMSNFTVDSELSLSNVDLSMSPIITTSSQSQEASNSLDHAESDVNSQNSEPPNNQLLNDLNNSNYHDLIATLREAEAANNLHKETSQLLRSLIRQVRQQQLSISELTNKLPKEFVAQEQTKQVDMYQKILSELHKRIDKLEKLINEIKAGKTKKSNSCGLESADDMDKENMICPFFNMDNTKPPPTYFECFNLENFAERIANSLLSKV